MTIQKILNGEVLTLVISGRLDTQTAPELEKELDSCLVLQEKQMQPLLCIITKIVDIVTSLELVEMALLQITYTTIL